MSRMAVAIQVIALCMAIAIQGCASVKPKPPAAKEPDIGALLRGLAGVPDDDEDKGEPYDFPITPYTQPTLLLDPAHGWESEDILVPDMPGSFPYVCFKVVKHRAIQCIYRSYNGGNAETFWVLPNKEKI